MELIIDRRPFNLDEAFADNFAERQNNNPDFRERVQQPFNNHWNGVPLLVAVREPHLIDENMDQEAPMEI